MIANLDDSIKNEVKLGTNNVIKVMVKGMVNILTKQGQERNIPYVYYAPSVVGYLHPARISSLGSFLYPRQVRNTPKNELFRSRLKHT